MIITVLKHLCTTLVHQIFAIPVDFLTYVLHTVHVCKGHTCISEMWPASFYVQLALPNSTST
jgi:hypothetical protein